MDSDRPGPCLPQRRRPAHPPPICITNLSIVIFLTVCTRGRQPVLARPDVHALLLRTWNSADRWRVGDYVIMPDHIHLFCAPADASTPLKRWVNYWQNTVTRHWTHADEKPIWQRDFWDTQLRASESYANKWEYVRRNPVRAGLSAEPDAWPYRGRLNVLPWHEPAC